MHCASCSRPLSLFSGLLGSFNRVPYVRLNRRGMMTSSSGPGDGVVDPRPVFFFDIDNCVRNPTIEQDKMMTDSLRIACNIHEEMQKLINIFFAKHLSLDHEDAHMLQQKYYKEYGLAIEGLTRHHKIDPLAFNREVDDALPLDNILKPDPKLRELLQAIDQRKVKMWLLTNAYVNHANRVVKLLQVEDLFEGVTYCDYGQLPLICKPSQDMYKKAEIEAGVPSTTQCYLVDDSHLNCKHAEARGWTTVHLVEPGLPIPRIPACKHLVHNLEQLRVLFPQLFKQTADIKSG